MLTGRFLEGRSALVTGGLSGIGLACAEALAGAGARVTVGGRRGADPARLEMVRGALGADALVLALDVAEQASVDAALAAHGAAHGAPPDILVNSAGISTHEHVAEQEDASWQAVIDVNLTGCMRTIRACLPGMRARRWGRIVGIASTAAHVGAPRYGAYCASKAGLLGLSRAVAVEEAPHGITAVTLSPSWVETEMFHWSAESAARQGGRPVAEVLAERAADNPQGRLIQPEEIAGAVLFCCSEAAAGLTGEDIRITAGALW